MVVLCWSSKKRVYLYFENWYSGFYIGLNTNLVAGALIRVSI